MKEFISKNQFINIKIFLDIEHIEIYNSNLNIFIMYGYLALLSKYVIFLQAYYINTYYLDQ
ncbi:hypothetical protein pb186bvf_020502 [Paramecium bursaria]